MTTSPKTRVAVIGASGIGKHHAKWWDLEGADVCAFAGTSEASVAQANETLKGLFDFQGTGYADAAAMLASERPDIVDVSSPAACHYEHVKMALKAGCHVFCEKPFVYDPALPREQLLAQARELVALAEDKGLRLGVCTQYVAGAHLFLKHWQDTRCEPIDRFQGHLASPAKGRSPDPARVWIDLAPHLLSIAQAILPGADIAWDRVACEFEGYIANASFDLVHPNGETMACRLQVNNTTEDPANIRVAALNGYIFDVKGGKDEEGVYCSRIKTIDGDLLEPDFMRLLIRDFLAGQPAADGKFAITNLDWLLRLLDLGRASA